MRNNLKKLNLFFFIFISIFLLSTVAIAEEPSIKAEINPPTGPRIVDPSIDLLRSKCPECPKCPSLEDLTIGQGLIKGRICLIPTTLKKTSGFEFISSAFALDDVRGTTNPAKCATVQADDGHWGCTDPQGVYCFAADAGERILNYYRKGYQKNNRTVTVVSGQVTYVDLVTLDAVQSNTLEIKGKIYNGSTLIKCVDVKLYKWECGAWALNSTIRTCKDGCSGVTGDPEGNYSFGQLPNGTYKVEPVCSGCTFTPDKRENITIPLSSSQSFDFSTSCTACTCPQ